MAPGDYGQNKPLNWKADMMRQATKKSGYKKGLGSFGRSWQRVGKRPTMLGDLGVMVESQMKDYWIFVVEWVGKACQIFTCWKKWSLLSFCELTACKLNNKWFKRVDKKRIAAVLNKVWSYFISMLI